MEYENVCRKTTGDFCVEGLLDNMSRRLMTTVVTRWKNRKTVQNVKIIEKIEKNRREERERGKGGTRTLQNFIGKKIKKYKML